MTTAPAPLNLTANPTRPPILLAPAEETRSDRLVLKTITEIAVRILFPFAVLWLMASVLPISFYAVVLTGAVAGASFLAAFLFQPENLVCPLPKPEFSSLLAESNLRLAAVDNPVAGHLGLGNRSNNCWINSIAQTIRNMPVIYNWLRSPAAPPELNHFAPFYEGYEAAAQNGRRCAGIVTRERPHEITSQHLRENLSQVSGGVISNNCHRQEDVQEGLLYILGLMPDEMQGLEIERNHYGSAINPPMMDQEESIRVGLPQPFYGFELCFPSADRPARLVDMLAYEMDRRAIGGRVNRQAVDGHVYQYDEQRKERIIVRPPPFLQITLKRFEQVEAPASILSKIPIINLFISPQKQKGEVKIDRPVQIDQMITLPTEEGPKNYALKCFLRHKGTAQAGHYIAYAEEADGRYCYDDAIVSRSDGVWEQEKSQGYVFFYELMP